MFDFIKKNLENLKNTISSNVSLTTKIKKGFFGEIKLNDSDIENFLWDFEVSLLESDVPLEVVDFLKEKLRKTLKEHTFKENIDDEVKEIFINFLFNIFENLEKIDLIEEIKNSEKPYKTMFLGPNGNGKTTTIAKIGYFLQKNGFTCVFSASDTFRAGAIEQLEEHGKNLGIKVIKHRYGANPTAVAFDAVKYAESKGIHIVLIDTSGRQETNINLMNEMKKMTEKIKPNLKILVLESIIGNNSIEKIKEFKEITDCVVITKFDLDTKGGVLLTCAYYGIPVLFLGTGQNYDDLEKFNIEKVIKKMIS